MDFSGGIGGGAAGLVGAAPWPKAANPLAVMIAASKRMFRRMALFDLDEFDGFMAGTFDHGGAGVPQAVGLFQEGDVFRFQLGDPGVEVGDAEADMVDQVTAAGRQRRGSLVGIP